MSSNIDEFMAALNNFASTVIPTAANEAAKAFGQVIYDASQDTVPVRTGKLKESGFIETEDAKCTVGYTAEYASEVNERDSFFSNAFYDNYSKAEDALKNKFQEVINDAQ